MIDPMVGERGRLALSTGSRHQLRLMLADERIDDEVDLSFENIVKLIQGEIDAVIGDPALRKIVGPDAFRPISASI